MARAIDIQFRFNVEKFVNLMAYMAKKTNYLDPLKATKLLYLIDRDHLVRNGRPVIGDFYVRMDLGPVPSVAYNILRDSYSRIESLEHSNRDLFSEFVSVEKRPWQRYAKFKAKKNADLDVFSDAEMESINRVLQQHGDKTGLQLSGLTHDDPTWTESPMNGLIDYRLFFKNCPDAQEYAMHLMEIEQEDRDYITSFSR